ncbi:hypothetical protein FHS29_003430 [Saccharothrix tamanrassetensis]|uniref:Uncharacterized protein n=1 Tax=Saccharothrix tamanrassetensis TaxID=1051531 RepID=A0A841CL62_9PSEU|nr:hypothetical protein [Saccharothrix tamanrassetensis]
MAWISLGTSGSVTRSTRSGVFPSRSGVSELKVSFGPAGT